MLAPTGLLPICQQMGGQSVLAIRTASDDRRVHELHLQDAWDDARDHGGLPADYGRVVFDDHLDLVGRITAIHLPDSRAGRTIEAA